MRCPTCRSGELESFFEVGDVPVFCNVLHDSREEARATARGDVRLGFCDECGMIYNEAFDPARVEYAPGYENSLHVSPRFQEFATALAERLVAQHGLRGVDVLEIGGGRGEFLELVCRAGDNRGVVLDPSAPGAVEAGSGASVRVVRQALSDDVPDVRADLLCSRHVLEHLPQPRAFAATVARFLARQPGCRLYLEVPNGLWTLRDLGIWDVIYEHCSYFSPWTLRHLLAAEGLDALDVRECFGGQFLSAETLTSFADGAPGLDAPDVIGRFVAEFASRFEERVGYWNARLAESARSGARLAVWGIGSKGVTFLNTVVGAEVVASVVDVSRRKQGRFVPGTGHQVASPEELLDAPVDEVVVMNPIYVDEIRALLAGMGHDGKVTTV